MGLGSELALKRSSPRPSPLISNNPDTFKLCFSDLFGDKESSKVFINQRVRF
jgi:hypothetical protein